MLSTIVSVAKSAQNCPNLPKSAQRWNFKIPAKIETLVFFKNKNLYSRRGTGACFHHSDFNPRIFHMLFLLSKKGLCMWISAYPLAENDFFLNVPHLLWVWDFEDMYLTHLETRIWGDTFHIYFKKWFFRLQNSTIPFGHRGNFFWVNFECYDLANSEELACEIWWTCRHRS
jgi:hypothetical protein